MSLYEENYPLNKVNIISVLEKIYYASKSDDKSLRQIYEKYERVVLVIVCIITIQYGLLFPQFFQFIIHHI